jgi:hypothetical protein
MVVGVVGVGVGGGVGVPDSGVHAVTCSVCTFKPAVNPSPAAHGAMCRRRPTWGTCRIFVVLCQRTPVVEPLPTCCACCHAQALFNLGYMHEYGAGLPQDFHLAKRFYDRYSVHAAARVGWGARRGWVCCPAAELLGGLLRRVRLDGLCTGLEARCLASRGRRRQRQALAQWGPRGSP